MERLAGTGYRAAIVGPEGSGKTTLLEDLEPRLAGLGFTVRWARLHLGERRLERQQAKALLSDLTPRDIILFDGADHLSWLSWAGVQRRSMSEGGLVITSHREGMLPTLVRTSTSAELLGEMVNVMLRGRQLEIDGGIEGLLARHGGNLRNAMSELYHRFAEM